MKSTRTTVFGVGFLTTASVLTLALGSQAEAQTTTVPFDTPAVSVKAGGAYDYDVTFNVTPLAAKSALAVGANGNGSAAVQATANLNDRRGFRAAASAISPNQNNLAPLGEATVAMDFIAHDPLERARVKVEVEFDAIADAGAPVSVPSNPFDASASSFFHVEVGSQSPIRGFITQFPNGSESVHMPEVFPVLLKVDGLHVRHSVRNGGANFHDLLIYGNGHQIEHIRGSGPLTSHKKIVMDVPVNVVQLITIKATANVNAFTYIDPVITPHSDNPEVVVTLRGAVDPNPPPLAIPNPEELTAAGIDLAPLQELGLIDSPSAISFLSPLPEADYKVGANVKVKFRLMDAAGTPIPDATAKSLVKACRVKTGLDTATRCARYNAKQDFFLANVKIPKGTSVGTHEVVAQVLEADGAVTDSATTDVDITPRD